MLYNPELYETDTQKEKFKHHMSGLELTKSHQEFFKVF